MQVPVFFITNHLQRTRSKSLSICTAAQSFKQFYSLKTKLLLQTEAKQLFARCYCNNAARRVASSLHSNRWLTCKIKPTEFGGTDPVDSWLKKKSRYTAYVSFHTKGHGQKCFFSTENKPTDSCFESVSQDEKQSGETSHEPTEENVLEVGRK